MKILLLVGIVAALTGCRGDIEHEGSVDDPVETRIGLTKEGEVEVERLLELQTDLKEFGLAIEELIQRREKQTLFVLTHTMFELPFDAKVIQHPANAPILLVERALDNLVVAEDSHDHLSALYFRALDDGGDVESTKAALLNWTIENQEELVFFGDHNQLSFPDLIRKIEMDQETKQHEAD
ncbi:hypothetical protein N9891_01565 [bacterium]|nr:hypothetical protein [bacterium]